MSEIEELKLLNMGMFVICMLMLGCVLLLNILLNKRRRLHKEEKIRADNWENTVRYVTNECNDSHTRILQINTDLRSSNFSLEIKIAQLTKENLELTNFREKVGTMEIDYQNHIRDLNKKCNTLSYDLGRVLLDYDDLKIENKKLFDIVAPL